jgi:multidrug efflux pump subunit AcrB
MRKLVTYFIKYPVAANVLLLLILVFGYIGMKSLRSTFFPEQETTRISINAVYPGASPSEIEEGIVLKIEDNLDGLTGIERVTSTSSENLGNILVEVDSDYDTDLILQDIKNEIDKISTFPDGMEPPSIFKLELSQLAISFAITGDNLGLEQLKQISRNVENDLKEMEGISKVEVSGFPEEEISIEINQNQLDAYNLSFEEVALKVRQNNLEITGGQIRAEKEVFLIRSDNKGKLGFEFGNIPVKTLASGQVLYLKDVAQIKDQWVEDPKEAFFNQKQGVIIDVNYTINQDILNIVEKVKRYIDEFNAQNEGVHADVVNDRSKVLQERINLLTENGVVGFFLVLLFLSMFLHPRLAGWVALSIPICFAGMFILASFYDVSINVISLFGMIIVIGILVDDGIVISENIFQHYEAGKSPVQAAVDGTMEVFPAVFSAIVTTIIAFSIFFFLDGVMGDFFVEMGFVVIATLAFSLVEGIFVLPTHVAHSKALKRDKKPLKLIQWFSNALLFLRNKLYKPLIQGTIKYGWITLIFFVAALFTSTALMKNGLVKFSFFPNIQSDYLNVKLEMQPGTKENVTAKWIDYAEQRVQEINDSLSKVEGVNVIEGIQKNIGPGTNEASMKLVLAGGENRQITTDEIKNEILSQINDIPDKELFSIRGGGPFGRPVSIAFYSRDDEALNNVSERFKAALVNLGTLNNIESSDDKGTLELDIKLNDRAKALGLSYADVMRQVRNAFFGYEVQRLQRGLDEVKVWVRYDEQNRDAIGDLEHIKIKTQNGNFLLKDLATIHQERGVMSIKHIDGKKSIQVEADIIDQRVTSSGEITGILKDSILPEVLSGYPMVSYSEEGQAREIAKTSGSIKVVGPIILILMFATVVLTFRSFGQSISVFIMSIFGIIGILWGHLIHGHNLSIFSIFGIIALIGVMINDSLVLVNAYNQNLKQGMKVKDALLEASLSRFRPIVLTSVTTIAGLGPLIFEKSMQAQFLIPMAITIAYGLLFATLLTLLFLPALLLTSNFINRVVKFIIKGDWPTQEEVEPAVKEIEYENIKVTD